MTPQERAAKVSEALAAGATFSPDEKKQLFGTLGEELYKKTFLAPMQSSAAAEMQTLNPVRAAIQGVGQGATMGYSDELLGAIRAAPTAVGGLARRVGAGLTGEEIPGAGLGEEVAAKYRQERDAAREYLDALRAKYPAKFGVGEVGGTIASVLPAGVAAGAIKGTSSLAARLGLGAATGAAQGAATGAGYSTGKTAGDVLTDTALGAGIGGVAGGAVPIAGPALRAGAVRGLGLIGKIAPQNIERYLERGAIARETATPEKFLPFVREAQATAEGVAQEPRALKGALMEAVRTEGKTVPTDVVMQVAERAKALAAPAEGRVAAADAGKIAGQIDTTVESLIDTFGDNVPVTALKAEIDKYASKAAGGMREYGPKRQIAAVQAEFAGGLRELAEQASPEYAQRMPVLREATTLAKEGAELFRTPQQLIPLARKLGTEAEKKDIRVAGLRAYLDEIGVDPEKFRDFTMMEDFTKSITDASKSVVGGGLLGNVVAASRGAGNVGTAALQALGAGAGFVRDAYGRPIVRRALDLGIAAGESGVMPLVGGMTETGARAFGQTAIADIARERAATPQTHIPSVQERVQGQAPVTFRHEATAPVSAPVRKGKKPAEIGPRFTVAPARR